jgi:hypothetical protein
VKASIKRTYGTLLEMPALDDLRASALPTCRSRSRSRLQAHLFLGQALERCPLGRGDALLRRALSDRAVGDSQRQPQPQHSTHRPCQAGCPRLRSRARR